MTIETHLCELYGHRTSIDVLNDLCSYCGAQIHHHLEDGASLAQPDPETEQYNNQSETNEVAEIGDS